MTETKLDLAEECFAVLLETFYFIKAVNLPLIINELISEPRCSNLREIETKLHRKCN